MASTCESPRELCCARSPQPLRELPSSRAPPFPFVGPEPVPRQTMLALIDLSTYLRPEPPGRWSQVKSLM